MNATNVTAGRLTAGVVLFRTADRERQLERALEEEGVAAMVGAALGLMSRSAREVASTQVAVVIDGLMTLDLVDLLLRGWATHAALVAAAQRTVGAPGSREVVQLATHRVTSQREFHVDVLLDRVKVTRVHLLLSADFVVEAVVGVVADGRLVDLRGGDARVTVTLKAEDRQLAQGKASVPIPGRLRLGEGLDLVARRVPAQPAG